MLHIDTKGNKGPIQEALRTSTSKSPQVNTEQRIERRLGPLKKARIEQINDDNKVKLAVLMSNHF
jgi:hypothetical protein